MTHDFVSAHQTDAPFVRDGINLRVLARRQRGIIWLIAGCIIGGVLVFGPVRAALFAGAASSLAGTSVVVALRVAVLVATIQFSRALRTHPLIIALLLLPMVHPFINLVVLMFDNSRASRILRKAGIPVGLLGARDEDIFRMLAPHVCRKCGYDLTGNTSGQCSECGVAIPTGRVVDGDGGA